MQYFAIPRQKPNSCIVSLFFTLFKLNTYYWLLFFSLLATWPGLAVTVTGPNGYCNTKARTAGCQQAGDQVEVPLLEVGRVIRRGESLEGSDLKAIVLQGSTETRAVPER